MAPGLHDLAAQRSPGTVPLLSIDFSFDGTSPGNVDSLPTRQVHPAPVDLQLSLPVQNVEELLRFAVTMAYLGGLGRHLFFNNAETVVFDQMPAVAHLAPRVVLGVVNMNSMESAHNLPLSNDARLSTTGAQGSPQGDRIDLR